MKLYEKISLYSLSMGFFYLITFLLSFKRPKDYQLGEIAWCKELIMNNSIIAYVSALLLIIDIGIVAYYIFYVWKGTRQGPIEIEAVERCSYEYFSFIASTVVPIVSFNLICHPLRHGLVLLIIYLLLGIIYIKEELYYANPVLGMLGFKLYRVSGKTQANKEKNNIMVLSKDTLAKGDGFTYFIISDSVYYAKK